MRRSLLLVLLLCGLTPSADACHGLLRRLFAPRTTCEPVEPKTVAAPKEQPDTLEGRVVWKGALPEVISLEDKLQKHPDKLHLLKAPKEQMLAPTWRIDPKTKGVANVCVYFKRPKEGLLPIHADDKIRKAPVVIDTPFCAYVPHMVAVYPEWFDGKDRGKTGQKLVIKNSSPLAHAHHVFGHQKFNPGIMRLLPSKTELEVVPNPQPLPLAVDNGRYSWMSAYVWVFDHPYFAITKTDGSFTIPRVPAGMEVQVMAWHEGQGWLLTSTGKTMTLKKGKNTLDIEMNEKLNQP